MRVDDHDGEEDVRDFTACVSIQEDLPATGNVGRVCLDGSTCRLPG